MVCWSFEVCSVDEVADNQNVDSTLLMWMAGR